MHQDGCLVTLKYYFAPKSCCEFSTAREYYNQLPWLWFLQCECMWKVQMPVHSPWSDEEVVILPSHVFSYRYYQFLIFIIILRVAPSFHQYGPSLIFWPVVTCGLTLLLLYSVLRGFLPRYSGFHLSRETNVWFDTVCCDSVWFVVSSIILIL